MAITDGFVGAVEDDIAPIAHAQHGLNAEETSQTEHGFALAPIVGRKGWLFADTVVGAHASANLYSLIETARANGIEPYRYLVWLFRKLPLATTADDYTALLPWNMLVSIH